MATVKGSASWVETKSVTHTTQSGTEVLIVMFSYDESAYASAVSFNGTALTLADRQNPVGNQRYEQWYLVNPDIGAYTLTVTVTTTDCVGVVPPVTLSALNIADIGTQNIIGGSAVDGKTSSAGPPVVQVSSSTYNVAPSLQGAEGILVGLGKGSTAGANDGTLSISSGTAIQSSTQYRNGSCNANLVSASAYNLNPSGTDIEMNTNAGTPSGWTFFYLHVVEYKLNFIPQIRMI